MKKVLPFLVVLVLFFGDSASFDARWIEKAIVTNPASSKSTSTSTPLAACSITISKITVSGCYLVNGLSKATVTAEISWLEAPTNGTVTVSIAPSSGTATPTSRTFKPGANTFNYGGTNSGSQTIVSPQVIAFEIEANGAVGEITAAFNGSCTTTGNYTAPTACPATPCSTGGMGGIVFNDYNGNGVRETALATVGGIQVESGETDGLAGVKVHVTDAAGNTFTTTTDVYGTYAIGQAITYPARVEFSGIPAEYNGSSTLNGSNSRTTVQFVSAASCNVNLGVNRPTDYCDTSPQMFTPCYVNGHPLGGGTSGADATLVSVPFNNIGKGFTTTTTGAANRYWSINSQTGSVWGLAYNRYTKKMFSAALLRRHTGFGPLGIGGIYVTDMTQSTPTNNTTHTSSFIDLDAAPFNVNLTATYTTGTNASQANNGRDLPAAKNSPSRDANAFILTGKDGLGDLDISENGDTLFAVNLHEKTLLVLNISAFNQDGVTKPTSVTSLAIPNPGCTNGEWRPWALKYYRGKLYVGGVCDGSNTAASAEVRKGSMRAYVYVYENGSFSPTPIMDFPLTYPRGYADANIITAAGWFPWTDNWNDYLKGSGTNYNVALPQPIFADIEFDTDGSMLIGLADRTGFQTGIQNYMPTGTATTIHSGFSGGGIS